MCLCPYHTVGATDMYCFFSCTTFCPFAEDFVHMQQQLQDCIVACGYVEKPMYWEILRDADVVVSTAKHEFFGLSMWIGWLLLIQNVLSNHCMFKCTVDTYFLFLTEWKQCLLAVTHCVLTGWSIRSCTLVCFLSEFCNDNCITVLPLYCFQSSAYTIQHSNFWSALKVSVVNQKLQDSSPSK